MEALAELREPARGLHPPVLSERGLPSALRMLATRSPVPVLVDADLERGLPAGVGSHGDLDALAGEVRAERRMLRALRGFARYGCSGR